MMHRYILFLIIGVDALILFFQTSEISISRHEASLLYGNFSFLQTLLQSSLTTFGHNDFVLRLPMILLHMASIILFYKISDKYIMLERNKIWLILIFLLLPGVMSASLLIDSAGVVIFGLLLFVYIYEKYSSKVAMFLLIPYSLIDKGFIYLIFSLIVFSLYSKDKILLSISIVSFALSLYIYDVDTGGTPVGHFIDAIGIYAAIYTPIIFVYIVYVLYRRFLTKDIGLLWFISAIPFILSLILSFRQRLEIEHYAPYLLLALPLAAQTFASTYRIRLKEFRKKYKAIFIISLLFLLFNSLIVLFHKDIYLLIENPKKHFAYKMHIAKELAAKLKEKDIYCIDTDDNMQERLKFYGITKCYNYRLEENPNSIDIHNSVTISYKKKEIYKAYVTKRYK